MAIKDWYKLTFQIESNFEDNIIWFLNDLGVFSYSFEYFLDNQNKKKVDVWLTVRDWDKNSRNILELKIIKLLNIKDPNDYFFYWEVIKEEDWLTSWKKYWGPELVGNNLVILPCWINLPKKFKDKKVLKIDPGAAFGTGSHPSTYLCLEKMENVTLSGKKVLDIGSGSGILGVAAKSFGAKQIYAIDNDYLAINSTKSNFQLNFDNLDFLKIYLGSFDEVVSKYSLKQFDFIMCNILADVIKSFIPSMSRCLNNNGEIILSGILKSQKDEILNILHNNQLKLIDISFRKDWVCIEAQKAINLTKA